MFFSLAKIYLSSERIEWVLSMMSKVNHDDSDDDGMVAMTPTCTSLNHHLSCSWSRHQSTEATLAGGIGASAPQTGAREMVAAVVVATI
jgi:hypothetical protein